jgi:hypothetical protein
MRSAAAPEASGQGNLLQQSPKVNTARPPRELLEVLRPKPCPFPLLRIGGEGDGAYLVPDDLQGLQACLSPGVQNRKDFEDELVLRHGIPCHMCDYSSDESGFTTPLIPGLQTFRKAWLDAAGTPDSITLDSWVQELSPDPQHDLMLQMDIEGAEYRNLLSTDPSVLARFRIIVIELHHLRSFLSSAAEPNDLFAVLELIDRHFICVHAHPNNCCGAFYCDMVKSRIPGVVELTLLRRDRFEGYAQSQLIPPVLPHPLDIVGNVPHKPPLHLESGWLGGAPRSIESEMKVLQDTVCFYKTRTACLEKDGEALASFLFRNLQRSYASPLLPAGTREDLAMGRPYVLTSSAGNAPIAGQVRHEEPFFFSTRYQSYPAITIDLGASRRLELLEVFNRSDAAQERARFLFCSVHDEPEPNFENCYPLAIAGEFLSKEPTASITPLAGAEARYVTVFSPERTRLQLAGISIFGA